MKEKEIKKIINSKTVKFIPLIKEINQELLKRLYKPIYIPIIALICSFLIIFSASAIYFLENDAQPEVFSSITASIWWATVSLATVGYGDIVPITVWGKVFASIISLIGIGVVAIPTGIISASFVTEIFNSKEN